VVQPKNEVITQTQKPSNVETAETTSDKEQIIDSKVKSKSNKVVSKKGSKDTTQYVSIESVDADQLEDTTLIRRHHDQSKPTEIIHVWPFLTLH
jgi:phage I-like protein